MINQRKRMFFDIWNYIEPDLIPDDEGNRILIKK